MRGCFSHVDFRSSAGSGVTVLNSPRAAYYDRAPLSVASGGSSIGGPHALTTVATYTVPTGRKAIVEGMCTTQHRTTAAAPIGIWFTEIQIRNAGLTMNYQQRVQGIKNAIADSDSISAGYQLIMQAGEILNCNTSDASTGGTTNQFTSFKVTEFDA